MSSLVRKKRVAEYFPERWVRKKLKLTYESDISDLSDLSDIDISDIDISDLSDTSDLSDIDSGYRSEEF